MKWIAYALALIALIIWGISMTVPPRPVNESGPAHRLPRVARLQLAQELPPAKTSTKTSPSVAPAPSPHKESSTVTSAAETPASASLQSAPTPKSSSLPSPSPIARSIFTSQVVVPITSTAKAAAHSAKATGKPALPKRCLVVSGIDSKSRAQDLLQSMAKVAAHGQLQTTQESLPPLHWVLTQKYPGRHSALRALRHLQQRGIDSFLVTQGQWANTISLGLYQSKRLAREARNSLRRKGIKAHIEPYERSQELFSIRFDSLSESQASLLRQRVSDKGEAAEKERIIACKGVASSGKSP